MSEPNDTIAAMLTDLIVGDPERCINGCTDCDADNAEDCGRCTPCCAKAPRGHDGHEYRPPADLPEGKPEGGGGG